MKLNRATVQGLTLPEGKSDHTHYDEDLTGFGLRVRSGGSRTWVAVYRLGRKTTKVSLGSARIVKPDEAREKAREILAGVALGHDANAARREERERQEETLGKVIEAYLVQHVATKQKPRTQAETRRHLERHWKPLHSIPIHQADRRAIAARLREIAQDSGPVAANRARACLSAAFAWAIKQGLADIDVNPVSGTAKPGAEKSRERVLTDDELRAIWAATEDAGGEHSTIVRLLMLTGQRREEVARMEWSEIAPTGPTGAVWTIPAGRVKNGRDHVVPLSAAALQALQRQSRREGRSLVFGRGQGGFSGWSRSKKTLDDRIAASAAKAAGRAKAVAADKLTPWTLHDLRRTLVTRMHSLGTQPHIVEAVVNHISGHKAGVAGVYNRAAYAPEKREALDRWTAHLLEIVGAGPAAEPAGGNVIAMGKRAAQG